MNWDEDGIDWPNRDASSFVSAAGIRWHLQSAGRGPVALLLHGTGAATHTWRGLWPLLTPHFTTLAPDLPGHGFTSTPGASHFTLPGMARAIADLLAAVGQSPEIAIGHSAGAAILVRMTLDGLIVPRIIVSINGALLPFRGAAGQFFSPIAKLLALNPFVPRLFSWAAGGRNAVERLIRDTGSVLDDRGVDLYRRLLKSPDHVRGALAMMANWDLAPLEQNLGKLRTPLVLIVGGQDGSIPPDQAFVVRDRVEGATVVYLRGLGHLAHEEAPQRLAEVILRTANIASAAAS